MILRISYGGAGPSTIKVCTESFQRGRTPLGTEVSVNAISDERIASSDEHLQTCLQGEMARLCQTLKLSVKSYFFTILFYFIFPGNSFGA